jgi:hypothetical protein
VIRGVWFNERILGLPVNPPPPGIPAIDPDTRGTTTIRDQLDKHRADAKCAACHARIDPAGFALECFDVIGGMRTRYRSLGEGAPTSRVFPGGWRPGYKMGPPVNTGGKLPDGFEFKDIKELRQHLLRDPERIARNFVQQLVTYATGAEPDFGDRAGLAAIVAGSREKDYGIRTLIHRVAESDIFQKK